MKKENKELARQRRAEERRRAEARRKTKRAAAIGIPAVIAAILIVWIVAAMVSEHQASEAENTEAAESTDSSNAGESGTQPVLNQEEGQTVEDGDTVNIDFVGTVDGVEFEGGNTNGSGADLTIGSGRYIDDFEEQLIGHTVGETTEVVVTFPENYGKEELNGKEAVFTVTINGIYE